MSVAGGLMCISFADHYPVGGRPFLVISGENHRVTASRPVCTRMIREKSDWREVNEKTRGLCLSYHVVE